VQVEEDTHATREFFQMSHCRYADMSPVIIDKGYTRRFLDGWVVGGCVSGEVVEGGGLAMATSLSTRVCPPRLHPAPP
jgi:hypothetical protein